MSQFRVVEERNHFVPPSGDSFSVDHRLSGVLHWVLSCHERSFVSDRKVETSCANEVEVVSKGVLHATVCEVSKSVME